MPYIQEPPVRQHEFASSNRDEIADFVTQTYVGHRPRFRPDRRRDARFSVVSAGTGLVGADSIRNSVSFVTDTDPLADDLLLYQVQGGLVGMAGDGEEHRLRAGSIVIFRTGVPMTVDMRDFAAAILRVPMARVGEVAAEQCGIRPPALRFESMRPVSSAMGRCVLATFDLVHRDLMTAEPAMANPLVAAQAVRMLAAVALTAFPSTMMTAVRPPAAGRVPPVAMRRAAAYIDEDAGRPLTLAEIAAAAGVSPHGLRDGFLGHFGMTPTEYLRRIRLERAHRDLLDADPAAGATVAAIAGRWGWASPRRFADAYRRAYGQLPGQTLRA
jgi:AraC-like DNA-binding protein